MRFRNIWHRPLPPRTAAEKATTLTILGAEEETKAKRAEIARTLRDDSGKLGGNEKMFRLFKSLVYEKNDAAEKQARSMAAKVIEAAEAAQASKSNPRKARSPSSTPPSLISQNSKTSLTDTDRSRHPDFPAPLKPTVQTEEVGCFLPAPQLPNARRDSCDAEGIPAPG